MVYIIYDSLMLETGLMGAEEQQPEVRSVTTDREEAEFRFKALCILYKEGKFEKTCRPSWHKLSLVAYDNDKLVLTDKGSELRSEQVYVPKEEKGT